MAAGHDEARIVDQQVQPPRSPDGPDAGDLVGGPFDPVGFGHVREHHVDGARPGRRKAGACVATPARTR